MVRISDTICIISPIDYTVQTRAKGQSVSFKIGASVWAMRELMAYARGYGDKSINLWWPYTVQTRAKAQSAEFGQLSYLCGVENGIATDAVTK